MNKPKVYLAGFDVFYPNAIVIGEKAKSVCSAYGFEGLFPMDNVIDTSEGRTKEEIARDIYQANISLIQQADFIFANLETFRGAEPDSGTCFEVGYGVALNKRVYGYIQDNRHMIEKVKEHYGDIRWTGSCHVDKNGMIIEDFNLPLNLMLAMSSKIVHGSLEDCAEQAQKDYLFILEERKIRNVI